MSEIRYGIKSLSPKYFNINSEWIIYISYPKITTEMIPILTLWMRQSNKPDEPQLSLLCASRIYSQDNERALNRSRVLCPPQRGS